MQEAAAEILSEQAQLVHYFPSRAVALQISKQLQRHADRRRAVMQQACSDDVILPEGASLLWQLQL